MTPLQSRDLSKYNKICCLLSAGRAGRADRVALRESNSPRASVNVQPCSVLNTDPVVLPWAN